MTTHQAAKIGKIVKYVRGIEEVVTRQGRWNPLKVKNDLDERIRQVESMGGLAKLSGEKLQWGRDVMDQARQMVEVLTQYELANFTEGTAATMLAHIASGRVLMDACNEKFQREPEIVALLQPGANSRLMPERRLNKWYLSELVQHPALMFHQAIEEGLKCLIYNDRPKKRPGHKDGRHELGKLLQTLTELNPRRVAEIETVHMQRCRDTSLWSAERGTVREILRLHKGLYRDARYNSQVWDRAGTSSEIRDPEELAMVAGSVYVVVRDLYMAEHWKFLTRLDLQALGKPENSYLKPPSTP